MLLADLAPELPDWIKVAIGLVMASVTAWAFWRSKQTEIRSADSTARSEEEKRAAELRWAETNFILAQHKELLAACEQRHKDDADCLREIIESLDGKLEALRERIIVLERENSGLKAGGRRRDKNEDPAD